MTTGFSGQKKLVVFAAAPGRLVSFERYLINQGWDLRIRSDFKQVLADVTSLKPKYVLLSLEARHPNLEQIRSLLEKIYRVTVIDFTEEPHFEKFQLMKTLGRKNVLLQELSGPAFEQILQSLEAPVAPGRSLELQSGVQSLMKSLFPREGSAPVREVSWVSRVCCFHLKSSGLNGVFVAALAGDKTLDEDVVRKVQSALLQLCTERGLQVESLEAFPLETDRLELKKWAERAADFLESGVHRGVEVVMTFLRADIDQELAVSPDGKFLRLDLMKLSPDQLLSFDLYLSLPLNGRSILYVNKGGALGLSQQLSLQSRQVDSLYAKVEDRARVEQSLIIRRLDQSIREFYSGRESKAG